MYVIDDKELMKEWDWKQNKELDPKSLYIGSYKKAWWICNTCRGKWQTQIFLRQKHGCPYCNKGKLLEGYNDLNTINPELAKEWHPTKNGLLTPNKITANNGKKVWWLGKCGHEWQSVVSARNKGGGCPYCSNEKLLTGFNDLATKYPELIKEWDYEDNDVMPNEIFPGTHKKVWWICPFGHKYKNFPYNRIKNIGCPICDKENHTSFPEQAIFFYLKEFFHDIENSNKNEIGMELDIYIPSKRIAIEYDGSNWHKNSELELKKNNLCKENNITLIRIREIGLNPLEDCIIITRNDKKSESSLNNAIEQLFSYLKIKVDIDVERDSSLIYNQYILNRKNKSVLNKYPELAKEWHPTKNRNLLPSMLNYGSCKKVWWLGKCGHEWIMAVNDRTIEKCGCPICNGKKILTGFNDFATKFPELLLEWNYELNNKREIYPNKVFPHSDKKVYWTCKDCGYIWETKIDNRTRMKSGCPNCARKRVEESRYIKVKCVESGKIYNSIIEAEKDTGINRICISNCCKGKQKTAGKYHWIYGN